MLPDALAKAGGRILAELEEEGRKNLERLDAEKRAVIAEFRADVVRTLSELREGVDRELARLNEAIARVKDGAPGKDGESGPQGPAGEKGERGEAGPSGERGEKGDPGEQGKIGPAGPQGPAGADGKDAQPITPQMVAEAVLGQREAIYEAVQAILAENPPKDGEPGPAGERGEPGERGEKGDAGERGPEGPAGRNGLDIAALIIDREGNLVATWTDGTARVIGPVVGKDGAPGRDGKDGAPGKDGRDGVSFDNLLAEYDNERTVTLFAVKGEDRREIGTLVLPIPIDRGVWKDGETYQRGDVVTHGGSAFIAQAPSGEKPEGSKQWRLAVKRGRDGKDGKDGDRGLQGPKGDPGLDGRKL